LSEIGVSHSHSFWGAIHLRCPDNTSSLSRQYTKLYRSTFHYLCSIVAPSLAREDTHLRESISLETRVVISLSRLSTGNTLQMCREVYGISRSSASFIVREFCAAIKKSLRPLVIRKQTESSLRAMAAEFEKLHGIPYIIGTVDGSHIPIIAPPIDPTSYYCRKGFYSALLQEVVDKDCKFWDFDFGWAGRCHDWTLFQNTEIGKKVISGAFLAYKLIGDVAYPMKPWFYSPFKGEKEGMSRAKAHWNFIQSSTRMAVERAFGILKGRWRIILKRIDMPLKHVPDLVTVCICLHNLCIIHGDNFDMKWVEKAQKLLEAERNDHFGQLKSVDIFHSAFEGIQLMRESQGLQGIRTIPEENDNEEEGDLFNTQGNEGRQQSKKDKDAEVKKILYKTTRAHELLTNSFYEAHLRKEGKALFLDSCYEYDTE
jgi:hypothetical protein